MRGKHTRVAFRILSTELGVEEISKRSGLTPTAVGVAGEPLVHGEPYGPRRRENVWLLDSPLGPSEPVVERLERVVALVEPATRRLAVIDGPCMMHFFLGLEPQIESFEVLDLGGPLLRRIADVPGEGLLVEVFAPDLSSPYRAPLARHRA